MIKGEQTKNKVIETAGDLFWKNGYANTGISDILKAADIPKGSFYFHFKKSQMLQKPLFSIMHIRRWIFFVRQQPSQQAGIYFAILFWQLFSRN